MTKSTKLKTTIRQKLNQALQNEDGFSFIEVIIVIAMILILSAILIPSYFGFVESARVANIKISAQNMYTTIQVVSLNIDSLEGSRDLYIELKKLNPGIVGISATDNNKNYLSAWTYDLDADPEDKSQLDDIDPYQITDFTDNDCAISEIEITDFGYSFTYYQYMNGKVYFVVFENGERVEEGSFNQNKNNTSTDDDDWPTNPFSTN